MVVPPSLPLLSGDRDRLMQVLVNLLSNAVKSCRADGGGQIGVVTEAVGDALSFCANPTVKRVLQVCSL